MRISAFLASLAIGLMAMSGIAMAQSASIVAATQSAYGTIAAGGTFQAMPGNLAIGVHTAAARRSLTVQNNNTTTDNCYLYIGTGTATTAKSILLAPGQGYTRYYPYVPSDPLQITCTTTGNSFYADYQ